MCDGNAEQEESEKHGQLVRVAEPSQVRRQLRRAREELVAGRKPLLDPVRLVARIPKQPDELDRRLRALRARRVGAPGRGDGADWLHGWTFDRVALEGLVRLQVVPELDGRPQGAVGLLRLVLDLELGEVERHRIGRNECVLGSARLE